MPVSVLNLSLAFVDLQCQVNAALQVETALERHASHRRIHHYTVGTSLPDGDIARYQREHGDTDEDRDQNQPVSYT